MVSHCSPSKQNLKAIKYETEIPNNQRLTNIRHEKIKPIPIIRRSLPSSKHLRSRIALEGHKYFSKFTASGEDTPKTLNQILKSRTLKFTQSFEFDPYFRKESCLRALTKVLHKIKDTKRLCLYVRRVERRNETNCLSPCLYKIPRLKILAIYFPRTANVDHKGLENLADAVSRCNSVRRIRLEFTNMRDVHTINRMYFMESHRKNIQLEELDFHFSLEKDDSPHEVKAQKTKPLGKFRAQKMKRISNIVSIANEWSLINEESSYPLTNFLQSLSNFTNLREAKLHLTRHNVVADRISWMFACFSNLANLHTLRIELLSCETGELETMTFAMGVSKMKYLKNFSFHILQGIPLSEECVAQFISYFADLNNLESIDLFFKRVSLNGELLSRFTRELSKNYNIQCKGIKNAIWASR